MGTMFVEMTFDKKALLDKGQNIEDVYYTIKETFENKGLPCVSESDILAFTDKSRPNDWGEMWNIICNLMITPWFRETATSLLFRDGNYTEDILAQAGLFNELM